MGNVKDGLRGLFLAAILVGLFLIITIVAINLTRPGGSEGEDVLIAFLMGFACARALVVSATATGRFMSSACRRTEMMAMESHRAPVGQQV